MKALSFFLWTGIFIFSCLFSFGFVFAEETGSTSFHPKTGKMLIWKNFSWASSILKSESERFLVENSAEPEKSVQFFALNRKKTPLLKPRLEKDCLVIDASAMETEKMENLTIQFYGLNPKRMGSCYLHFVEMQGPKNGKGRLFFEGKTKDGKHFWKMLEVELKGYRQMFFFEAFIPNDLQELFLRYDFTTPGEYRFFRSSVRHEEAERIAVQNQKAELIFHLPFDGSAVPTVAAGEKKALKEQGIEYVPGLNGLAARFTSKNNPILQFPRLGNLIEESGSISVWIRLENFTEQDKSWRMILAEPFEDATRIGSGAIWCWIYEGKLRGDVSDMNDSYVTRPTPTDDGWRHVVFTWNAYEKSLYLDGKRKTVINHEKGGNLATPARAMAFSRIKYDSFFIGNYLGRSLGGVMDDLKIYSAPLTDEEVNALYREHAEAQIEPRSRYFFEDEPILADGKIIGSGEKQEKLQIELYPSKADENKDENKADGVSDRSVSTASADGSRPIHSIVGEFQLKNGEGRYAAAFPKCAPGIYRVCVKNMSGKTLAAYPVWIFHAENTTGQRPAPVTANHSSLWDRNLDLRLIQTIDLVEAASAGSDVFSKVGEIQVGQLDGEKYLETAPVKEDRFAVRIHFPEVGKLYLLEYVFPDDKCRSTDIILQSAKFEHNDYDLQVGYATGDEYPNSGKMITQRYLYYPRSQDSALLVMNARNMPAGAALAKVRVYAVESPLPQAQIRPAKAVNGWTRPFGIYFEDPAVGYDFGNFGYEAENFETMLDRLCAYMKYSGQNMFSYPFVWYDGVIGDRYNPRNHPPRCMEAFAKKFDREGLEFMATMNQNNVSFDMPFFTRSDILEGKLNDSILTIHSSGTPHPGGWHDSPPIFNILHPDIQKMVLKEVDEILDVCAEHPSFKGITLHLPMHSLNSLGDIRTGLNDFMIRDFEKETGIRIPVDKTDPARGKLFYEWLMKNAREEWVDWRCRKLSAWYETLAKRLAERRADLKLGIHCITPILYAKTVYDDEPGLRDFWFQVNRDMGIDARYLAKIPNVFVEQSVFPADYRWMRDRRSESLRERLRLTEERVGRYASLLDAPNAWVHQFDRYWESDVATHETRNGRSNRFPAEWLDECTWRVTTLNPVGFHAMKHYIMPFRFKDTLGLSKGGFLIGTYGMEPWMIPFAQAYRALPAVEFSDVEPLSPQKRGDAVKIRRYSDGKNTWFYVVNTDLKPAAVTVSLPAGQLVDLAGNRRFKTDGLEKIELEPYSLRSFMTSGDVEVNVKKIR